MRTQIIITDLTRMTGNKICVAGVLPTWECIRPVRPRTNLTQTWLYRHHPYILKPFAVMEMELIRPSPDIMPPHTEDWEVELNYRYCHDLTSMEQYELLHTISSSHLRTVFGTDLRHNGSGRRGWIPQGSGTRSLGTIHLRRVQSIVFQISPQGKGVYRIQFEDEAGETYQLPVTDLAFRMYLDSLVAMDGLAPGEAAHEVRQALIMASDVFLRLGLSRFWGEHPDRCYLQVNGIYFFPDYLGGRCFANFIEQPTVEVPF